ncbi:MAG: response regulator [Lachnospiraceae bacterium]|nr:response regulator [Lachnospiraceae bacterium]
MVGIIGNIHMLRISFSIAALAFSIVLYILVCILGTGQVHKNHRFRSMIAIVILGNFISILDYIFRMSGIFPTPQEICLFLLLAVFEFNVVLTYYMAVYVEGFISSYRHREAMGRVNRILFISSIVVFAGVFLNRLLIFKGPGSMEDVPLWVHIVLGYAYELYFMIYAISLFIVKGKSMGRRARYTAIAAYSVCILAVIVELFNTIGTGSGILFNYFGAVIGMYIFYIGVETPDYKNLLQSMKDLETAKEAADEANVAKSAFLANMSHEIRTPINAVIGMNEMIIRESREEPIVGYARDIETAGKNLLSIINDILDLSKIEAGKMEIRSERYDLKSLIDDVVNMTDFKCKEKGLDFIVNIDPGLPKALLGDDIRMRQIIVNLLNNAVKYTNTGSVTMTIEGERIDDYVALSVYVKDTGIGIKNEDMDKIFGKFDRVDADRNRGIEGTGLGLAITSGLLEAMGGNIRVCSEYAKGSEFMVHVPQRIADPTPIGVYNKGVGRSGEQQKNEYRESFHAPEALILHVDDTPVNHTVMKGLLKKTGVKIDKALSGPEAVDLAANKKYDIILMDYRMPHMDGVEALRAIRSDCSGLNTDTPVICLTADAVNGARDRYLSEGFTDYLTKPVDAALLEDIMIRYLPEEKIKQDEKQ